MRRAATAGMATALAVAILASGCKLDGALVTVDTTVRHQTIEGFGSSGCWTIDPVGEHWSDEQRRKLARLLFSPEDGIGLSVWKFNAGASGIESQEAFFSSPYAWRKADTFDAGGPGAYDWTAHEGQRWFLEAARDLGVERFTLIFYSPPRWATKNGLTHPDGESGTTNLRPERTGDFARYMADVAVHVEDEYAIDLADVVPLNEPNWAWSDSNQEANRYAVADIKRVVTALGRELASRGVDARIATPEAGEIMALLDDESYREYWRGTSQRYNAQNLELSTGGKFREYGTELLGDPTIRTLTHGSISAHSYWSDYSATADDRLVRLRELVRADLEEHLPGATYLQTEYCILGDRGPGRDLTMESAISVAEVIHRDLTILDAAEWSWWLALSPHDYKDGLLYTDWERPGDEESILASRIFFTLGQYSRFIRPGYRRVDATLVGDDGEFPTDHPVLVSAYVSPDERRLIVVAVNTSSSPQTVVLEPSREFEVYRTSDKPGEEIAARGSASGREPVELPSASVTTFVSRKE